MPIISLPFQLAPSTIHNSNHTLTPRKKVATDPTGSGWTHQGARRSKINDLPGGFRCVSADVPEFKGSIVIQADDPNARGFAGRRAGGGTRLGIYGNRRYGSGYPNATTEGVKGRDLPFFFYPVSYGRYPGYGPTSIYDHEYGGPDNKHRPGGRLHFLIIQPPKSLVRGPYPEIPPMTLYAIADKPTLKAIKAAIRWRCSRSDFSGWVFTDKVRVSKPRKFRGPAEDPNGPVPEQAVGHYRGSSVVLSLVGYNNSAQVTDYTLQDRTNLVDTPLPSVAETAFFRCINITIGQSIPLVIATGAVPYQTNAASSMATPPPGFGIFLALVIIIWLKPLW